MDPSGAQNRRRFKAPGHGRGGEGTFLPALRVWAPEAELIGTVKLYSSIFCGG